MLNFVVFSIPKEGKDPHFTSHTSEAPILIIIDSLPSR